MGNPLNPKIPFLKKLLNIKENDSFIFNSRDRVLIRGPRGCALNVE
jgi:hypothetical protein